jgi:hypothetical protein
MIVPTPAGVVRLIYGDGIMNNSTPNYLDAKRSAAYLSLSISTLAKLRLSGNGPTYSKLGRRVIYRVGDLNKWVESRLHKSTSEYPSPVGSSS